jgi:hypothetical protein
MSHLVIKDGKIVNWIVVSPEHEPPVGEGEVLIEWDSKMPFDIDWDWDGSKAINPAPPTPPPQTSGGPRVKG